GALPFRRRTAGAAVREADASVGAATPRDYPVAADRPETGRAGACELVRDRLRQGAVAHSWRAHEDRQGFYCSADRLGHARATSLTASCWQESVAIPEWWRGPCRSEAADAEPRPRAR